MTRTRLYRDGKLELVDFPPEDISEHLADKDAVVWLDLCRPTPDDFQLIREELGLHVLAVEDATSEGERPKLDRYRTHLFVVAYAVRFDARTGDLTKHEVSMFVTERALITVRKDEEFELEPVLARWDETPDLAKHGVAFLLYGVLDEIVDGHFDAVRDLDEQLEALEDQLFRDDPANIKRVQRRSFRLRRSLVVLRRIVLPMREVVNSLMRPTTHVIDDQMVPYYQDVYDHVLRASEWTESLRDFVTTILETNLTVQGNRLNSIMKKVTSWAAIIAVPTAVTGFYGQNVPYPGYGKVSGVIASLVIMLGASVGLYFMFKRRDWL
jgi:magnesium transporter